MPRTKVTMDTGLLEYATDRQREYLKAVNKLGGLKPAAKALEVNYTTIRESMQALKRNAAKRGYAPEYGMVHPTPEGFHVKGVSTYTENQHGEKQWVKTNADKEEQTQHLLDAVKALCEPFQGQSHLVKSPKRVSKDLLSVYPIGDPHFGMYCWAEETGQNFDLKIAERDMTETVDKLVHLAPETDRALVLNLGDFFHTDNSKNITNQSGHSLDVDSRYPRMLKVGILTMEWVIRRALQKSKTVDVINCIGNHDEMTSHALSMALWCMFRNDDRVNINTSPNPFKYYRHGHVFLGTTHGDNVKAPDLPGIMAADQPKDWGESKYRFWYTGHVHHDSEKEYRGCKVETFRTLAPKDGWHNWKGYRALQDMKLDIFHKTAPSGRINRHVVGLEKDI